jgi:hypothetical protein
VSFDLLLEVALNQTTAYRLIRQTLPAISNKRPFTQRDLFYRYALQCYDSPEKRTKFQIMSDFLI